jgi:hypothetical protein
MKAKSKATQEPLGIVISFPRQPQTTVFSAYVWAPAPTTPEDSDQKAG